MSDLQTIINEYKPPQLPADVIQCPFCIDGRMPNGSASVSCRPDGTIVSTYTPGTPCGRCRGRGLLRTTPYNPEQEG